MSDKQLSKEELTVKAMQSFQQSPFEFIEAALGEVPQPIKAEHREYVLHLYKVPASKFSEYAKTIHKEMFEPFVKGKHLTWQQSVFCIAVQRAVNGSLPPKIAVKAGRGTGKSSIMARLILWYLFSFPLAKIPCTAPTADPLFSVLWSEINLVLSQMKPEYAAMFEWESKFIRIKQRPQVWYARAKTAGKGETGALSGIHADYMASFADESYDIEDDVFQVAEATQTGEKSLMILAGNAVHDHGYFYDCFNKYADSWITLTMNAEESPIVNQQLILDQEKMYGRQSNHYRASILGEFPIATAVDNEGWTRMFSDHWIDTVMPKDADDDEVLFSPQNFQIGRTFLGVDPSGEGTDEMIGYLRNSTVAMAAFNKIGGGPASCALATIGTIETFGLDTDDVTYDNFGVGAELGQEIAMKSNGQHSVRGKNVGDKPEDILDSTAYLNERARMYDALYWWGKRGGRIRYDEVLREELKTIFKRANESGKMQLMPKREMRKRGFMSPNRCFVAGTKIATPNGERNIEDIVLGDYVYTPLGARKVNKVFVNPAPNLYKVTFTNGKTLIGTGNHKLLTKVKGNVSIDALTITDMIESWETRKLPNLQRLLSMMAGNFGYRTQRDITSEIFTTKNTAPNQIQKEERNSYSTDTFGKKQMERKYLKDLLSTTKTTITSITNQVIWKLCQLATTLKNTGKTYLKGTGGSQDLMHTWRESGSSQQSGINQKKVESGTGSTVKKLGQKENCIQSNVSGAANQRKHHSQHALDSVQVLAPKNHPGQKDVTWFQKTVLFVAKSIKQISTQTVEYTVVQNVQELPLPENDSVNVYNISVETDGVYYANGVLVSNCDAIAMTTLNDRMLSNYIPRANFRGLPKMNNSSTHTPEEFDPHSMIPSF